MKLLHRRKELIKYYTILFYNFTELKGWRGRCGGVVVSALDSRRERSGFEPWPGTLCCVFAQDTSHSVSLLPGA